MPRLLWRHGHSLLAALALLLTASGAHAQAGALDPSFGDGGIVLTDPGGNGIAFDLAVLPSGEIVVAGRAGNDIALVRYAPDGSLDPAFGEGGIVTTDLGGAEGATAIAVLPDGKMVVAGVDGFLISNILVARYTADGALDPSFGDGGTVITDITRGDVASDIGVFPGGEIVVVGSGDILGFPDFVLARYTADGALDPSFGDGGIVVTNLQGVDDAYAVGVLPDGKVVVAGRTGDFGRGAIALVRYTVDGTLDPSFGDGGVVTTYIGLDSEARDLVMLSSGEVLVAGRTYDYKIEDDRDITDFALVRYTADGALDDSFGNGGIATTDFGRVEEADALGVLPDGKIAVAGYTREFNTPLFDIALARYTADGALDASFGGGGTVITDIGDNDQATALGVLSGGEIVVTGFSISVGVGFVLAKYLGDAAVDLTVTAFTNPIQRGGTLEVFATVDNTTDTAIRARATLEVEIPGGLVVTTQGRAARVPANRLVGPGRVIAVTVPENARRGEYTADLVLTDEDTGEELDREPFTFTLPAGNSVVASGATEWALVPELGSLASPAVLSVSAPTPNPARGVVTLGYAVPLASEVSVVVYDALGREVAVAARGVHEAGRYEARVDLGALAPGVYVARLTSGGEVVARRFTVVR